MKAFYTLHNLQGSQTRLVMDTILISFYTLHNLQGSQTSTEIITEPTHSTMAKS